MRPLRQAVTVSTEQRVPDRQGAVADALDLITAERLVALLTELVAVPSFTGSAAESEAQHLLAPTMRAAGLETDLWQVDLAAALADPGFPGMEAPRDEAWGLVGSTGGDNGPTLVLNGHIDVVPLGDPAAWTVDPWGAEVREDRVLGRGAADMKAGLACQVMTAAVLAEAGVGLRGRLLVQSVVGEEDGGLGTYATLQRGYRGDAAVICEPTSLMVLPACAGALTFRLTVPGLSAHGSVRDEGVDAVDKYLVVHQALRALEARRNVDVHPLMAHSSLPYPLSVGTVRAGDWPSSVPDLLVAEGRYGVALEESVDAARAELEACLAEVCASDPWLADHPLTLDWYGGQFAPGVLPTASPLLEQVRSAHRSASGATPVVQGAPYGSDLRLLTAAGVPTVLYGPGDVRDAHAPDESVAIEELLQVTRTLVLLAVDICGVA
jgi:acetylornithine deacetylase